MLFNCWAILPWNRLGFFSTKSLVHRPCLGAFQFQQLSTLTQVTISDTIPNVILHIIQAFHTPIMRFTSTPGVTPKILTFICIWDNILKFLVVLFNSWKNLFWSCLNSTFSSYCVIVVHITSSFQLWQVFSVLFGKSYLTVVISFLLVLYFFSSCSIFPLFVIKLPATLETSLKFAYMLALHSHSQTCFWDNTP